jgi:hypothetical protein
MSWVKLPQAFLKEAAESHSGEVKNTRMDIRATVKPGEFLVDELSPLVEVGGAVIDALGSCAVAAGLLGVFRAIGKGLEYNNGYVERTARVPSKHRDFWRNANRTTNRVV